jgi:hypothetical protein
MQKWEYLTITAGRANGKIRVSHINGELQPDFQQGEDVYVYLNELGEQGWELVAAPFTEVGFMSIDEWHTAIRWPGTTVDKMYPIRETSRRFIFKRPKA